MKNIVKTQAFVIRKRNYLETDKILMLLTKDYGRMDVLVRGARKQGSKIGGLADCFMFIDVELEQKRGFDILKDASLIHDYRMLESTLSGLGVGGLLSEIVDILTYYEQNDSSIYDLFGDYLSCYKRNKEILTDRNRIEMYISSFLMSVLALSGRIPIVDCCCTCEQELNDEGVLSEFGICHTDCIASGTSYGIVNAREIELIRSTLMLSCDDLIRKDNIDGSNRVFGYCMNLYNLYHQRELKSLDFLNNVYKNL